MRSMILKSFAAENFLSFADPFEFTMQTDTSKKESGGYIFPCGNDNYNAVSIIYGANGSGKTGICKALREIDRIISYSPLTGGNNAQLLSLPEFKDVERPIPSFAFDMSYREKPTRFMIELIKDDVTFHYEFEILDKKIVSETLTKKRQRTEKLIVRTSPSFNDITLKSDFKGFESTKHVVKEESLCLAMAAFLNNPIAQEIVNAIKSIRIVSMTAARLQPVNPKDSFSDNRIEKYVQILQKADPTIRNMKVSVKEEELSRQKIATDDFENREFITKKMTVGIETQHALFENGCETGTIPIQFFVDESLGTIKLLTALPYLYDTLESGGVLVVDEIENGLHLSLVKEILNLFMSDETNPHHAQLICTSHQPLLVDGNFRRDQVWITSKDAFGKSQLHRMSARKTTRAKVNLTNRILEGAFGCNPEPFFNQK